MMKGIPNCPARAVANSASLWNMLQVWTDRSDEYGRRMLDSENGRLGYVTFTFAVEVHERSYLEAAVIPI